MGYPLRALLKQDERLGRSLAPLKRIGEIDRVMILFLYDVKHMFKLTTDVQTLCFCANDAFEELLFNPESYKCCDRLMTWFMYILRKKSFLQIFEK